MAPNHKCGTPVTVHFIKEILKACSILSLFLHLIHLLYFYLALEKHKDKNRCIVKENKKHKESMVLRMKKMQQKRNGYNATL